jgi:hypothetical protein
MVRDIPGFYYGLTKSDEKQEWVLANLMLDAEKKKYFKIQPNHAGPGQQHSKQVIKQKEGAIKVCCCLLSLQLCLCSLIL